MDEKCFDIKKRCYFFSKEIVKFVNISYHKDINFPVYQQLLKSGTSIGANIVEAISASSKRDFINYYKIALKSANETKYWICLIRDTLSCDKIQAKKLLSECVEISNIIGKIVKNTKLS